MVKSNLPDTNPSFTAVKAELIAYGKIGTQEILSHPLLVGEKIYVFAKDDEQDECESRGYGSILATGDLELKCTWPHEKPMMTGDIHEALLYCNVPKSAYVHMDKHKGCLESLIVHVKVSAHQQRH